MININNKLDFHANQDKRLRAQKVQLITRSNYIWINVKVDILFFLVCTHTHARRRTHAHIHPPTHTHTHTHRDQNDDFMMKLFENEHSD